MAQTEELGYEITESNSQPIDFAADDDSTLIGKINARIADTKPISEKKRKEYNLADAYLDGEPSRIDNTKADSITNDLFPIVRNMTGLITDSRPHPGVKITRLKKDFPQDELQKLLDLGDSIEKDLNNWWDNNKLQSRFQRIVFGQQTYADFFILPFWNEHKKDADIEPIHPRNVRLDTNADDLDTAEFAVVEFFKGREFMYKTYGKDNCKDILFMDYAEARTYDADSSNNGQYKLMKNVCKLELFMTPEWWVYKSGTTVLKKMRNPYWVPEADIQKKEIQSTIEGKYKKGVVGQVVDKVKGVVGMETDAEKMMEEVSNALTAFTPKANFFTYPRIALVHFDTYRMAGEMFSRSIFKSAIRTINNINDRQDAISKNAQGLGKPTVYVDGSIIGDEDAAKLIPKHVKNIANIIRVKTDGTHTVEQSVKVAQGTPMPEQFFEDMITSKKALDNLFGHHEVSKGAGDPTSRTKGGILALQEADQTPIRYLVRNIEDALQELFGWVIQIKKLYCTDGHLLEVSDEASFVDYSEVSNIFSIFIKSGSMMPVSREQQRADALEMFKSGAMDPLTLFERLDDPDPETAAKRLQAWVQQRQVLPDGTDDAVQAVVEKVMLIKQNKFDEVQISPGDDAKVHHDMLLVLLKSNTLTPEQENFVAQLITQYSTMANSPTEEAPAPPAIPSATQPITQ